MQNSNLSILPASEEQRPIQMPIVALQLSQTQHFVLAVLSQNGQSVFLSLSLFHDLVQDTLQSHSWKLKIIITLKKIEKKILCCRPFYLRNEWFLKIKKKMKEYPGYGAPWRSRELCVELERGSRTSPESDCILSRTGRSDGNQKRPIFRCGLKRDFA